MVTVELKVNLRANFLIFSGITKKWYHPDISQV